MNWDLTQVRAVAEQWEKACRAGQSGPIVDLLSDDAVVWYNFEKVDHDREAYRAILDASYKSFRNPQYRDFRVMHHPGGFVEQATLEGETDNGVVSTPFLIVATVKDDKITRLDEYFDSTVMRQQG
jgi:ketosteroid isomerase-like protein